MDPKIVEPLVQAARPRAERSPLAELTPREREVLAEIAQGKSNAAIAESLVLTKRAVEKHINSIFMKLNLSRRRGREQARQGDAAVPGRERRARRRRGTSDAPLRRAVAGARRRGTAATALTRRLDVLGLAAARAS